MARAKSDISLKQFLLYASLIIGFVVLIFVSVFIFKFDISKFADRLEPIPSP